MRVTPAGHRVLIKPDKVEMVSDGGIIQFMNEEMERAGIRKGHIVAIGDTAWIGFADNRPWAKVGDYIYYTKFSGSHVPDPITDEDFVIIRDEDVLTTITLSKKDVAKIKRTRAAVEKRLAEIEAERVANNATSEFSRAARV